MAKPRAGMVDPGHSLPRLFTSHSAAQLCFTLSRLPVLSHQRHRTAFRSLDVPILQW